MRTGKTFEKWLILFFAVKARTRFLPGSAGSPETGTVSPITVRVREATSSGFSWRPLR